jgi:hypothetical protein
MSELRVKHPWHHNGPPTIASLEQHTIMVPGQRGVVGIVTERADNPGLSITNNAEHVVEAVRFQLGLDVLVVEHYGHESYDGGRIGGDTFDQVEVIDGRARWRWLGNDQADALAQLASAGEGERSEQCACCGSYRTRRGESYCDYCLAHGHDRGDS